MAVSFADPEPEKVYEMGSFAVSAVTMGVIDVNMRETSGDELFRDESTRSVDLCLDCGSGMTLGHKDNLQNRISVAAAYQGMGAEPVKLSTAGMLHFISEEGQRVLIHGFGTPDVIEDNPVTRTSQVISYYELRLMGFIFQDSDEFTTDSGGSDVFAIKMFLNGTKVMTFRNRPENAYGQYWATVKILPLDRFPPTEQCLQRLSPVGLHVYERGLRMTGGSTPGVQRGISLPSVVPVSLIRKNMAPRAPLAPDPLTGFYSEDAVHGDGVDQ
jgi:hypothetical protein